MNDLIKNSLKTHSEALQLINESDIINSANIILKAIEKGKTIFWCGNGGSASQANHLSAELVGGMYKKKIQPFKSICLNTDTAFITVSKSGDILIGLSTSGNSENILNATEFASTNNLKVISFTGNDGGKLIKFSDANINIKSDSTQRIQEMHILIGHILCDVVEHSAL